MISRIIENHVRLERKIRANIKQGKKLNVLVLDSSSNTAKVSLLAELRRSNSEFNVSVLSHDQSVTSRNLYKALDVRQILGGTIEETIINEQIDILFIDNPHYYYDFTKPTHDFYKRLSATVYENALICYIPYAYISVSSHEAYTDFFHSFSWRFFLESYFHLTELEKHTKGIERLSNQVITGHPYLDPYFTSTYDFDNELKKKKDGIRRITWCPHHNPVFYGGVSIAEQELVLRNILEKHNDIEIFFRPHPNFFAALKSKTHLESNDYTILLNSDLNEIFEDFWLKNERVIHFDKGPVYQLFKSSDLIIHNCGGYQMEAVVSRAKIINLVNKNLLNDHMLQYQGLQQFCSSNIELEEALSNSLDTIQLNKNQFTGHEDLPQASSLIVNHIKQILF